MIEVPKLLDIPQKMLAMIKKFNEYRYCVAEGGRGGGKSIAIGRFLLYLGSLKKLRILCLREIQNSIEESVYQLLVDIITEFNLDYDVKKSQITHRKTGTTIRFKGCREQGAVSLKSMEGVSLVFVEEAQSMSKVSLDILIPTIRKEKAKLFFAMNRFVRNDPVYETLVGRDDTLHININYTDNPFCPKTLINEANKCKEKNIKEYNHIWLGQPLATTTEYLFNFDKLAKCKDIEPFGDPMKKQRVMGVDFASGGGDLCVASLIERTSNTHWRLVDQVAWDNPDTDESVGKTIGLYGEWNPDIMICDKGGLGYPMFVNLSKTIHNIIGFDGAGTDKCTDPSAANHRYQAYLDLKTWIDKEWIQIKSDYTLKELETIKKKYKASGKIYLVSKPDQKKEGIESQDRSDSVAMAVHGAVHYLGKISFDDIDRPIGMRQIRKANTRKRIM